MADNREAKALMEQAKKTTEKFFSFGKGKYGQAAELYTRAGNLYKASKNCLLLLFFFLIKGEGFLSLFCCNACLFVCVCVYALFFFSQGGVRCLS